MLLPHNAPLGYGTGCSYFKIPLGNLLIHQQPPHIFTTIANDMSSSQGKSATGQELTRHTALPTQTQFLDNGLEPYMPDASDLDNAMCSICVEDFKDKDQACVKLVPCGCSFHKNCIMTWFESTHERRGTCPNDRTVLFQPDRLPSEAEDSSYIEISIANEMTIGFLRAQEAVIGTDEVISAWHTANEDGTASRVRAAITFLQSAAALRSGFSATRSDRLRQLSNNIEADYIRFQTRYTNTVKAWARERVDAFLVRIQILQAVDQAYDIVSRYHKQNVEELVKRIQNWDIRAAYSVFRQVEYIENSLRRQEEITLQQSSSTTVSRY